MEPTPPMPGTRKNRVLAYAAGTLGLLLALLLFIYAVATTGPTTEQRQFACAYLHTALTAPGHSFVEPYSFTRAGLQRKYGLDPPGAVKILDAALEGDCPQYRR